MLTPSLIGLHQTEPFERSPRSRAGLDGGIEQLAGVSVNTERRHPLAVLDNFVKRHTGLTPAGI